MSKQSTNNFAFIDGQNLHLGIKSLGWALDYRRFRVYLKDKYNIQKAYLFIGYVPENQEVYKFLQENDYILVFKPVFTPKEGKPKGNVDADLVLQAMIEYPNYDKALIVTSDGDFYSLIHYLYTKKKLESVLAPNRDNCSILLRKKARERIQFIDDLKQKLVYVNKK